MTEPISTDYTQAGNPDSMQPGIFSAYRVMYWMVDILKNFFADPINIKDDRLQSLLWRQDSDTKSERLKAVFEITAGYPPNTQKASTTPMIVVLVGDTTHDNNGLNLPGGAPIGLNGAMAMYYGQCIKLLPLYVSVTTESYSGTILLAGYIEDFLTTHAKLLQQDSGMLSSFQVIGTTAPKQTNDTAQAKDTFESLIQIQTAGCIGWTVDTQGPVFRGLRASANVN